MNDITSKLRKAGIWAWHQKEKVFLGALLIVLCFRVWVVLRPADASVDSPIPKPPVTGQKPPVGGPPAPPGQTRMAANDVPDPPPRPVTERADDYRPLVRQNPFTIYSILLDNTGTQDAEGDSIDVTLNNIMKWSDGAYRAELTTKVTGKSKRYKEGEVFENYKLMSIDAANKTVTIYSSAHDKTFELKMPGS
ncbi:MAG: hypothetical protein HUU46_22565 [Candidatus Hydrogenedentes bacterium]|nr:hypothetical protein [Candidatus Hydrogenedentota bacterium]